MPGRLGAPEGGMAPEGGLKAGMESDSARLEAIERLGDDMPPRRAASSCICSTDQVHEEEQPPWLMHSFMCSFGLTDEEEQLLALNSSICPQGRLGTSYASVYKTPKRRCVSFLFFHLQHWPG